MAQRILRFDWSAHTLGPVELWPASLQTAVSLMLNSQHPMWIGWGAEMTFLYNDAYLHVLGLAKHPWALGRPASEVWAEIWDVCGPLADKVFDRGEASFVDEVRLFMNRGAFIEETFYSFSYSPIRDEAGNVRGLFCPSNDVTPKVIGARRLRTLSELSANALIQKSVESACESAAATLAKNPDDVPFAVLYVLEGDAAVLKHCIGIRGDAGRVYSPAVQDVISSGRSIIVPVEEREAPLGPANRATTDAMILPFSSAADGRAVGALVAGVNPTRALDADYRAFFDLVASNIGTAVQNARAAEYEKRRAEMLAEMDRAKTVFFSNVSHEFRTPLTLMLGPLQEISQHVDSSVAPLVETAQRNSLRLLKLVNTLLEFSRVEAGRADAAFEETDLAALTGDLSSSFRSAIEQAGLNFIVDVDLAEHVFVDRAMWEKIVLNLLSNALKFTLRGHIRVTLCKNGDRAELRVEDTGSGIPQDELPRIFERFHRVHNDQARSFEGSGIGLALTRDLVALHGGTIEVQSRLGEGSTFIVRIPLGRAHVDANRLAPASDHARAANSIVDQYLADVQSTMDIAGANARSVAAASGRPRILVADDNADLRQYVQRILAPHFDVDTVPDGAQALERARTCAYDLILSDVMMPKMDGFELLRAIRGDERLANMPFICLSARAGEEAAIEGLERGADAYLVKPFSAQDLITRVEAQLHTVRRREDEVTQQAVQRWFERAGDSRTNETIFRAFADEVPTIIFQQDIEGAISYVNTAWYDYTRLPRDPSSFTIEAWKNVVHPDDLERILHAIEAAIPSREPYEFEYRIKAADASESTYRWHVVRAFPQRDHAGAFRGWIGSAVDIHDARNAAEQLDVFARLGAKLSETLDSKAALLALSGTLVPMFADWCLINLVDESGKMTLAEARHHNPAKMELLAPFIGKSYERSDATSAAKEVFSTGKSIVYERVRLDDVRGRVVAAFEAAIETIGFRSVVVVPIVAGGKVRGTFHAFSHENGRTYTQNDVPFFEEIGRRIGAALENAESFERQARISRSFQDAALPVSLPEVPGIEFSSLYAPATSHSRVGGDFYDAFRLPDGRLVVSVGDVAGAGLEAAATMAALRQSIRAAASINPDPQLLLKAGDGVFNDNTRAPFASAFVAVIDPLDYSMQYASAGHPAVLLRRPDGSVTPLGGTDLLLGVNAASADTDRHVNVCALEPGSLLVLYTDGLIEATHDPADGEYRLEQAVSRLAVSKPTARNAAFTIRDGVLGPNVSSHDDVAILTVFLDEPMLAATDGNVLSWSFACDDEGAARRTCNELCAALQSRGMRDDDLFAAKMVFSELIGNVVHYAPGAVDVALDVSQTFAVLHMLDSGHGFALNPKLPTELFSERGRGLYIVKELSRDFTTSPRILSGGTHARAVLNGAIHRRFAQTAAEGATPALLRR